MCLLGGGVIFVENGTCLIFDLGLLETQSRGPIQQIDYDMSEVSTRNGMLHPSCMGLAVQP